MKFPGLKLPHLITVPPWSSLTVNESMSKKRVFGDYTRDDDGKQTRNLHTPSGKTHVGTQSFVPTPDGQHIHEAWLFKLSGEEEARRKENGQSIRDARNKAKRKEMTGKPTRKSLADRAESLGI